MPNSVPLGHGIVSKTPSWLSYGRVPNWSAGLEGLRFNPDPTLEVSTSSFVKAALLGPLFVERDLTVLRFCPVLDRIHTRTRRILARRKAGIQKALTLSAVLGNPATKVSRSTKYSARYKKKQGIKLLQED